MFMSNLLEKRSWLKKKEKKIFGMCGLSGSVDSFILRFIALLVSHRLADYIIWNILPFFFICKSLILSVQIT